MSDNPLVDALFFNEVLTVAQWQALFNSYQTSLGFTPVNRAGDTMQGEIVMFPSTTGTAGLSITPGVDPASPNDGDIWTTASGLYVRINGVTIGPLAPSGGVTPPIVSSAAITMALGQLDYVFTGSTPRTWTLPVIGGGGSPYFVKNRASVPLTIAGAGSNKIFSLSLVPSIIVMPGDSVRLIDDATDWDAEFVPASDSVGLRQFVNSVSPAPLTAADTIAAIYSSTSPTIVVDANLTVTVNTTIAAGLQDGGGVIHINDGVTLHCASATGSRKTFSRDTTGLVIFDAPRNPIPTMLFCEPGDGIAHDCLDDLNFCFASQPSDNAQFVGVQRRHHLSAPLTFPASTTQVGATCDWKGALLDHALRSQGVADKVWNAEFNATLNATPVGQKISGFEQRRGGSSTSGTNAHFKNILFYGFPENGEAFGTHDAASVANYEVSQTIYENVTSSGNGRCGIYTNPLVTLNPRSWFNQDVHRDCITKLNGDSAIHLDGNANYDTFDRHYAESNNESVGCVLTGITGTFVGGEVVTGSVSGATARVSRFSAAQSIITTYLGVGAFQTGDVLTGSFSSAVATISKFTGGSLHVTTPLTGGTGSFTQYEQITGGSSGATAFVADWDGNATVANTGILIVYNLIGQFTSGETVTGSTSGSSTTVTGVGLILNPGATGDFTIGETVNDTTSGASGVCVAWNPVKPEVFVANVTGTFSVGDTVVGVSSAAQGIIDHVKAAGSVPGGNILCSILACASVTGPPAFVVNELVTGSISGVTAWIFRIDGNTLGVRGLNANGNNFLFVAGETLTGTTSGATTTITTATLGGGWSSVVLVTDADTNFQGGYFVDSVEPRYVADFVGGRSLLSVASGARWVGSINGNLENDSSFHANGNHRATPTRRTTSDSQVFTGRRITVNGTSVTSPVALLNTDSYVDVINTSGSGVVFLMPSSPATGQVIIITDEGGQASGTAPYTLKTSDGVTTLDAITVAKGFSKVRWNSVRWNQTI